MMLWKGDIRPDNGPAFVALDLRKWLAGVGTKMPITQRVAAVCRLSCQ